MVAVRHVSPHDSDRMDEGRCVLRPDEPETRLFTVAGY